MGLHVTMPSLCKYILTQFHINILRESSVRQYYCILCVHTLCTYKSILLLVAVHVVGVDVVRSGVLRVALGQQHARVIVAQHVRVPVLC